MKSLAMLSVGWGGVAAGRWWGWSIKVQCKAIQNCHNEHSPEQWTYASKKEKKSKKPTNIWQQVPMQLIKWSSKKITVGCRGARRNPRLNNFGLHKQMPVNFSWSTSTSTLDPDRLNFLFSPTPKGMKRDFPMYRKIGIDFYVFLHVPSFVNYQFFSFAIYIVVFIFFFHWFARLRWEELEFKVRLGYMVSLRAAWAT
jgi:hypothetical protein